MPTPRIPLRQILIYLLIGGIAFLCEISIFHGLREITLPLGISNIAARSLAAMVAFTGNRIFTFSRPPEQRGHVNQEALRYIKLFLVLTTLSTGLLYVVTHLLALEGAGIAETLAKMGVEFLMVCISFISQRLWVFTTPPQPSKETP